MTPEKLVSMALEAMQRAYAPYSGYKVGAALLCRDGSVVCGANIIRSFQLRRAHGNFYRRV